MFMRAARIAGSPDETHCHRERKRLHHDGRGENKDETIEEIGPREAHHHRRVTGAAKRLHELVHVAPDFRVEAAAPSVKGPDDGPVMLGKTQMVADLRSAESLR